MKRKEFLRNSAVVMLPALLNGFSVKAFGNHPLLQAALHNRADDSDRVLVIIQLFGGNDGLNTVIPVSHYRNYYHARPNIAIAEQKILSLKGVDSVGLHPSLSGLRDIYNEGKLAILHSVGYENPNFSHFRSSDIWMSASQSDQTLNTGWAARYLDELYPGYPAGYPGSSMQDPLAIQIGTATSFTFQGYRSPMGVNISNPENVYDLSHGFNDPVPATGAGEKLGFIREIAAKSQSYSQVIKAAADKVTLQKEYPDNNSLATQLKIVARLIKGGLKTKVYLVSYDGFDTHAQQVMAGDTAVGRHADLLKTVGDAIKAFQLDLEWLNIHRNVTGMTFSEFGRRISSNDSLGTDHGAAAPLFVFGAAVKGNMYGTPPEIADTVTNDDNIPMQIDFRQVYASLLEQWMTVPIPVSDKILSRQFQALKLF